jgi:hypothetical protein
MAKTAKKPGSNPKTGAERMAAYRARMRAKGLVLKTMWLPDMNNPTVRESYRRAAKAIAAAEESEREITGFFEQLEEWPTDVPEIEWPKKKS